LNVKIYQTEEQKEDVTMETVEEHHVQQQEQNEEKEGNEEEDQKKEEKEEVQEAVKTEQVRCKPCKAIHLILIFVHSGS
jgi:hypothetical protein